MGLRNLDELNLEINPLIEILDSEILCYYLVHITLVELKIK